MLRFLAPRDSRRWCHLPIMCHSYVTPSPSCAKGLRRAGRAEVLVLSTMCIFRLAERWLGLVRLRGHPGEVRRFAAIGLVALGGGTQKGHSSPAVVDAL